MQHRATSTRAHAQHFAAKATFPLKLHCLAFRLALSSPVSSFTVPGNLATFVDEYEGPETDLEQAVSEADTTTTVIGVGAVSACTSGDPSAVAFGKSSPLSLSYSSPTLSSPLLPSFSPSSGVIAVVASIENKRTKSGACSPLASKAVEVSCTAASFDTELPHEALSAQDKDGEERIGLAGKGLESRGVEGAGGGRSEHVVLAKILENCGTGVAGRQPRRGRS